MNGPREITGYQFGPFVLDIKRQRLLKDGERLEIAPKVLELLACLIQAGGEVLTKDDLVEAVWHGAPIADSNIGQHVHLARLALGDLRKPYSYIRTVQSRGYSFAAVARAISPESPALRDDGGSARFAAAQFMSNGAYFLRVGTPDALASAVEFFKNALALAPSLSQAFAAIAWTALTRALYGYQTVRASLDEAEWYSVEAIRANPNCPDALLARAAVSLFKARDPDEALHDLSAAERAGANLARLTMLRTQSLVAAECYAAACTVAREAMLRDPTSRLIAVYVAFALYHSGEIEAAADHLRRLLMHHPSSGFATLLLGYTALAAGRSSEAHDRLTSLLLGRAPLLTAHAKYRSSAVAGLAYLKGRQRDVPAFQALRGQLLDEPVPNSSALAIAALGIGDTSGGVAALKDAYAKLEPWTLFICSDPLYVRWRNETGEARFSA